MKTNPATVHQPFNRCGIAKSLKARWRLCLAVYAAFSREYLFIVTSPCDATPRARTHPVIEPVGPTEVGHVWPLPLEGANPP